MDTVVFLWWLADDPRLGAAARRVIEDPAREVYVSAASGWEIAIKRASGKLIPPEMSMSGLIGACLIICPLSLTMRSRPVRYRRIIAIRSTGSSWPRRRRRAWPSSRPMM